MTAPKVERAATTTARLEIRAVNSSRMTPLRPGLGRSPTPRVTGGSRRAADTPVPAAPVAGPRQPGPVGTDRASEVEAGQPTGLGRHHHGRRAWFDAVDVPRGRPLRRCVER